MKSFPLLLLALLLMGISRVQAQIVYSTHSQNSTTYLTAIDLSTCTACVVFEWPGTANQDVSILPDGRVVLLNSSAPEIFVYTLPDPTPTIIALPPPAEIARGSIVINGLMYIHNANGLYAFDPLTNQINFIGAWPPAMTGSYEFYELGGQVYAIRIGPGPSRPIWQIDLQNPGNSVFVQNTSGYPNPISSATSVNGVIYLGASPWLVSYDPVANTFEEECNLPSMGITAALAGLTFLPAGVPAPPCICSTEAGDMQAGAFDLCGNEPVQATHNGNEVLDGNDLLRFILFSDLNDTLGSIVFTTSTPVFNFAPPLQYGQTYYIAAIAGNNLNGSVDLDDPCLDVSNAVSVVWQPLPTVVLSVPNTDVCVGGCVELQATLTGEAPFTLSGNLLSGGNVVGTFNQTFAGNSGLFTVCVPPGVGVGTLVVQAAVLTDANCTCI
jgi:hypothetical protein